MLYFVGMLLEAWLRLNTQWQCINVSGREEKIGTEGGEKQVIYFTRANKKFFVEQISEGQASNNNGACSSSLTIISSQLALQ